MPDDKIRDQAEIATIMKIQQEIQNKITEAMNSDNKPKKVSIGIGDTTVIIRLLEDDDGNVTMSSEDNIVTGTVTVDKKTKKVKSYRDVDVDFNKKRIHEILDAKRRYELGIKEDIKDRTVDKNDSHALQMEVEKGLKDGTVTEMDNYREFSEDENMHTFVSRAWKISCTNVYRVKGKGTHDFKYVAKTSSGKYQELDLSTTREGTNSRQKITILENGKFKEKTVNSLLIRGRYGIATDIPDSIVSSTTRSYIVTRTPKGGYIAIAALEKQGKNRTVSGDKEQKRDAAKGRSVYEYEDTIAATETAEKIYAFNKDGKLTTSEVELVKKLKTDKKMDDKEVFTTVVLLEELKDMGYKCDEMKRVLSARSRDEILELAKEVDNKKTDVGGDVGGDMLHAKSIHDNDDHSSGRYIPGPKHG